MGKYWGGKWFSIEGYGVVLRNKGLKGEIRSWREYYGVGGSIMVCSKKFCSEEFCSEE